MPTAVFIVFEGLDGSGKTTAARRTAERIGALFMTTPSPRVRQLRDALIEDFRHSQEAQQLFYLATVFAASEEIRAHLAAGRSVVLDRYFLSTQAYAAFRGSLIGLDELSAHLLPADLTVMVEAPLEIRRARLATRGATDADRETLTPTADARLQQEHAARTNLPVIGRLLHVDSEILSPDGIADRVAAIANRLLGVV